MPNRARGKHSKKGNEVVILVTDLEYNTGKMCERFFFSISNKRHGYAQCISLLRLITRKKATNFSSLCVYRKNTQKSVKMVKNSQKKVLNDQKCIYWNETFRLIFKHRVILSRERETICLMSVILKLFYDYRFNGQESEEWRLTSFMLDM